MSAILSKLDTTKGERYPSTRAMLSRMETTKVRSSPLDT